MSDMVRVLFPADHGSTLTSLPTIYHNRGQLVCLMVLKRDRPMAFDAVQAERLARDDAILAEERCGSGPLLLIANGSYQLEQMRHATQHLAGAGQTYRLVYLQEPGRFRTSRDRWEVEAVVDETLVERLFPGSHERRVLLTHMRTEVTRGRLWPILPGARHTSVLDYRNRDGTLDETGMQFANRACWSNVLAAYARLMEIPRTALLAPEEAAAVTGKGDPALLR